MFQIWYRISLPFKYIFVIQLLTILELFGSKTAVEQFCIPIHLILIQKLIYFNFNSFVVHCYNTKTIYLENRVVTLKYYLMYTLWNCLRLLYMKESGQKSIKRLANWNGSYWSIIGSHAICQMSYRLKLSLRLVRFFVSETCPLVTMFLPSFLFPMWNTEKFSNYKCFAFSVSLVNVSEIPLCRLECDCIHSFLKKNFHLRLKLFSQFFIITLKNIYVYALRFMNVMFS